MFKISKFKVKVQVENASLNTVHSNFRNIKHSEFYQDSVKVIWKGNLNRPRFFALCNRQRRVLSQQPEILQYFYFH